MTKTHLLQKLLKLGYCPASLEKPQAAIGASWPQHELLYLHSPLFFSPLASTLWLKPAQSQTKPKEQKKDTSLLLMEPRLPQQQADPTGLKPRLAPWGFVALWFCLGCSPAAGGGTKAGLTAAPHLLREGSALGYVHDLPFLKILLWQEQKKSSFSAWIILSAHLFFCINWGLQAAVIH